MLNQEFVSEMKAALLQKKEELEGELKNLSPHTEEGSDVDSNAQEVQEDEVSQDLIATFKSDLEKINKALAKIEAGTYGTDDEGNAIDQERLRIIPWADKAI
jgi:RNA polymerase-binding transcription factor DksA